MTKELRVPSFVGYLVGVLLIFALTGCVGPLAPVIAVDPETSKVVRSEVRVLTMGELEGMRYQRLGPVEALSCKNKVWDPAPSRENAIDQLSIRAQNMGANAIAGVTCGETQGTDLATNCWSSVTCYALAVRLGPTAPDGKAESAQDGPPVGSSGSAFVVSGAGDIVTNAHVVASCNSVVVEAPQIRSTATVLAIDSANDLAILRTNATLGKPLPLRDAPRIRPGENVVVLGFPLSGLLAPDVQVATGSVTALAGISGDTSKIQISAPIQPGSSGGPVLDAAGGVIGVAVSKLNAIAVAAVTGDIPQNVNFAISAKTLESFLDANEVSYGRRALDRTTPAADIAANAKASVLRVVCN